MIVNENLTGIVPGRPPYHGLNLVAGHAQAHTLVAGRGESDSKPFFDNHCARAAGHHSQECHRSPVSHSFSVNYLLVRDKRALYNRVMFTSRWTWALVIVTGIAFLVAWYADCLMPRSTPPAYVDDGPAPAGVWKMPSVGGVSDSFRFDGKYITLHLMRTKLWMWKTDDEFYRVKSKWVGDDLYLLPPFGTWTKLATFTNGHFERSYDSGATRVYERVQARQLAEDEWPLLLPRTPHDYAITPRGGRDTNWRKDD